MESHANDRPQARWVEVTAPDGRAHLEMRWSVSSGEPTAVHAA